MGVERRAADVRRDEEPRIVSRGFDDGVGRKPAFPVFRAGNINGHPGQPAGFDGPYKRVPVDQPGAGRVDDDGARLDELDGLGVETGSVPGRHSRVQRDDV